MGTRAERLDRASRIVAEHAIGGLDYMISDPLDPANDHPVDRYMLVTHTDHSSDAGDTWIEFVDTLDEVLQKVIHLLVDEWALGGAWDLDSDDYVTPLSVRAELSLADGPEADSHRHSLVI